MLRGIYLTVADCRRWRSGRQRERREALLVAISMLSSAQRRYQRAAHSGFQHHNPLVRRFDWVHQRLVLHAMQGIAGCGPTPLQLLEREVYCSFWTLWRLIS